MSANPIITSDEDRDKYKKGLPARLFRQLKEFRAFKTTNLDRTTKVIYTSKADANGKSNSSKVDDMAISLIMASYWSK